MKKRGIKIIISAILFVLALVIPFSNEWINNGLFIISYLVVGCEILKKAVRNIFRGKVFDENFLMAVATIGAFAIGEFPEAVAVMLFYQVGELFQSYAVDKSRKSISSLMDIRPDYANIEKDGKIEKVDPDEVKIGDIIIVKTGEKIPLDGVVVEGTSSLDTMALTGESVPRVVKTEDEVLSGCINKDGLLKIRVTKEFGESTVSKILDLVENASSKKSKSENFITKFAKYYTPTVVIIAVLLAFIPPIILKDFNTFSVWLYRALSFLVVSCPCALVISIPLSFFGGIGGASKMGILIKGSNYLDSIKDIKEIVFDKTGTITTGEFYISKINIHDKKYTEDQIMEIFAGGESLSNHPIAKSVLKNYTKEINHEDIKDYKEVSGKGIEFTYKKDKVRIGNAKFCKNKEENSNIYLMINNSIVADLEIKDEIKKDAIKTIQKLKNMNINIHMFTGDTKEKATEIAQQVGIDNINYSMLPSDKYTYLEEIIKKKTEKSIVSFVGDGINDAPVLKLSDLGISMGSLGTDSAIEASDVVIMNDNLEKIVTAINISKKTNKIIKENLIFALGVKLLVLVLTLIGLSTMLEAVFADVGVTVLCILNTLRLLKK